MLMASWHQLSPANGDGENEDVPLFVPEDVEGTLVWRYGMDWRVPKPNYKGRDAQSMQHHIWSYLRDSFTG